MEVFDAIHETKRLFGNLATGAATIDKESLKIKEIEIDPLLEECQKANQAKSLHLFIASESYRIRN